MILKKRCDASNYECNRPLTIGKQNSDWINER